MTAPRRLVELLRPLAVLSSYLFFWGGGVLLAWVVIPFACLIRDEPRRIRVSQWFLGWAYRLFHGYMRLVGLFEVQFIFPAGGQAPSWGGAARRVVFVANHPTLVDAVAILSHLPHLRCVTTEFYTKNALLGHMFRASGFLATTEEVSVLEQAKRAVEQGFDLLLFPEGTRSPPEGIHPFHRGAFEIAKRTNAAIVPLLITCIPRALGKGVPLLSVPRTKVHHRIEVMVEFLPEDYADAGELQNAIEQAYRSVLATLARGSG